MTRINNTRSTTRRLLTVLGAAITALVVPAASAFAVNPVASGGLGGTGSPIRVGGAGGPSIPAQGVSRVVTQAGSSGLAAWAIVLIAAGALVVGALAAEGFRALRRHGTEGKLATA
jgi:hypothetical protein